MLIKNQNKNDSRSFNRKKNKGNIISETKFNQAKLNTLSIIKFKVILSYQIIILIAFTKNDKLNYLSDHDDNNNDDNNDNNINNINR